MTFATPSTRSTSGANAGSTTQSIRAPGCAAPMSATTGSVWTTSPSDDSLTIRTRMPRSIRAGAPTRLRSMRRRLHAGVRLDGTQRRHAVGLDARERLVRGALEAQHEHRRRVRRAHEAEAVVVLDAHAVDRDDLARAGELRLLLQPRDDRRRLSFGAADVELGSREARRQRVEDRARVGTRAHDLEQPRRRVRAVVEAVPALAEEDVAAHL